MENMLTKEDKKYINNNFDKKFDKMAIMIQRGFDEVYKRLDTKADKKDLDNVRGEVADLRHDLRSLENRLINGPDRRLDRVEDEVRVIKTKLKLK